MSCNVEEFPYNYNVHNSFRSVKSLIIVTILNGDTDKPFGKTAHLPNENVAFIATSIGLPRWSPNNIRGTKSLLEPLNSLIIFEVLGPVLPERILLFLCVSKRNGFCSHC
mmetsp:Transcript_24837/g.38276  ORF Transcript_24837/g.38276 Transcript_24837/m.38276 type:complete len:110 (-) Transcript_24837:218-547(-)